MTNFEKPASPLTLVPDLEKSDYNARRVELNEKINKLADQLVEITKQLRDVDGKLSPAVKNLLNSGMSELQAALNGYLNEQDALKKQEPEADSDVGPWTVGYRN